MSHIVDHFVLNMIPLSRFDIVEGVPLDLSPGTRGVPRPASRSTNNAPQQAATGRRYLINGPNKTVLSTNPESFSANGFSTGFIAREAFYTI